MSADWTVSRAARTLLGEIRRRTIDALAVLAFPGSLFAIGWLQPSSFDPRVPGGPPLLVDVVIALAGAAASLALAVIGRRMAAGANGSSHSGPVTWLVAGWPLPFPRRREPEVPVSGMPVARRPA